MALEDQLNAQLALIGGEISRRSSREASLDKYYEGNCPFPAAVRQARVTRAYSMLVGLSDAPWGSLVVDSVLNRLQVTGINSGDKSVDDQLWQVWQANAMDSESKLAHNASLVSGRSFALVWPNPDTGEVEISLDPASQMAVLYAPGSRRRRQAAMRYWTEGDESYATLYRPDGLFKFSAPDTFTNLTDTIWERYQPPEDEEWPVPNPFGVVPVVELPVNRRLKPGRFGYARGEFAHCTSLLDRINLLTFLGLVVAFYMGFPLRGVIGEKIRREVLTDDDGNAIVDTSNNPITKQVPLFDAQAGGLFQIENPQAQIASYPAADRNTLSIYAELDQLSSVTHTPRHYMPLQQGMTNLSADAIRASEGSLVAKVPTHKATLGEGHEEVLRLCGMMLDTPVELPQTAELTWADHETRSLAERADAAVKLATVLPQTMVAQYALNLSAEQLAQAQAERAGDALTTLVANAVRTPTTPVPVATNGAVPPPA